MACVVRSSYALYLRTLMSAALSVRPPVYNHAFQLTDAGIDWRGVRRARRCSLQPHAPCREPVLLLTSSPPNAAAVSYSCSADTRQETNLGS